ASRSNPISSLEGGFFSHDRSGSGLVSRQAARVVARGSYRFLPSGQAEGERCRGDYIARLSTPKLNAPSRSERRGEGPAPGHPAGVCLGATGRRRRREAGPRKGLQPPEPALARTGKPVEHIALCSAKTARLGVKRSEEHFPRTNTIPRCLVLRLRQECVILEASS